MSTIQVEKHLCDVFEWLDNWEDLKSIVNLCIDLFLFLSFRLRDFIDDLPWDTLSSSQLVLDPLVWLQLERGIASHWNLISIFKKLLTHEILLKNIANNFNCIEKKFTTFSKFLPSIYFYLCLWSNRWESRLPWSSYSRPKAKHKLLLRRSCWSEKQVYPLQTCLLLQEEFAILKTNKFADHKIFMSTVKSRH